MLDFDENYIKGFEFGETGRVKSFRGYKVFGFVTCEKHGDYPTSYGDEVTQWPIKCGCPKCAKAALIGQRLQTAMIPPRFLSKTFDNFETNAQWQKEAKKRVEALAVNFPETLKNGVCLTLLGTPGTGKTHLACAYANAVISQGYTALFASVSKVIRSVRSSWGTFGTGSEESAYSNFVDVDLLILDEVGVQAGSENEQQIIFNIINERYNAVKPTVIISNKDREGVKKYLGERVWDRLKENGGICLNFNAGSYRK